MGVDRLFALCSILAAVLSGCGGWLEPNPQSVPVVPVQAVINSLKCGFAQVLAYDVSRRSGLYGATAHVELDVNVEEGVDASGHLSVGIPVSGVGNSLTPNLSLTHSEDRTINSVVNFDIDLRSTGTAVCGARGDSPYEDAGFSSWIGAVVAGVDAAVAGPPKARMIQYIYESDFTVKNGATVGADAVIIPVKVGASLSASRSDVQHMKITIPAVSVAFINGKQVTKKGGGPFFMPRPAAAPLGWAPH